MRFIIFGLWWVYYYTIGWIVFHVQLRRAKRESARTWRESLRRYQ